MAIDDFPSFPHRHIHYYVKLILPSGRRIPLNERFVHKEQAKHTRDRIARFLASEVISHTKPLQSASAARAQGGMYQTSAISIEPKKDT